jgi:ubiquinone/menaquinone biosynthesis C-methylase UbiE
MPDTPPPTSGDPVALRRADMPVGSERLLETRSLVGNRRLAALLRPGMRVLDVGCGSGAITRGIAAAVSPGQVVGLDVSRHLLEVAASLSTDCPNLHFKEGSVLEAGYAAEFDLVTAARVLQWLAAPLAALRAMVGYTRPGGQVLVLDYNHLEATWDPPAPPAFGRFYAAFLAWREQAGMDNGIADRLPEMFRACGLADVTDSDESESTDPSDPAYLTHAALWCDVVATRGHQMVADGALTEAERIAAEAEMRGWVERRDGRQTLCLRACVGRKP